MKKMDDKRKAQEALNRSLSGLRENPFLARRIIAEAKGETKMKRHISKSMILALVLSLALAGTAYAAITYTVPEFFGRYYGKSMGDWLRGGRAAQIGESVTVGGVVVSLDEVVYRDSGLYGVGTVRAADEKDVLISLEAVGNAEYEPAPVRELFQKAAENGGRLLMAEAMPAAIGVDGGAMLTPGCIGYYDVLGEDGALTFSFEVEDRFSLEDGEQYALNMDIRVNEVDQNGAAHPVDQTEWTVAFTPVRMETTKEPETDAAPLRIAAGEWEIVTPEDYQRDGTLPVYRAEAMDFTKKIDPAWFNQSGVAEKMGNTGVRFTDCAELIWSREGVWYKEYTEEMFDYNAKERENGNPDTAPMMGPVPALSNGIMDIASNAFAGVGDIGRGAALEKTRLTHISLEEAKETLEALLEKLGLSGGGLACGYALDMSVERIKALGEEYNRFWFEGGGYTNNPRLDYGKAAAADEGYFLFYSPGGLRNVSGGRYQVFAYVTADGVRALNLRSDFARGEKLYTPDQLISPEEAVKKLAEEAAKSRYTEMEGIAVRRVALGYTAARAQNPEDGMVFVPMWQIAYQDAEGENQGYLLYAEVSAVDGALLDASF
ncbi:MAG: hypothetical protein IKQ41_02160 [Clostridia bacterium]|nr:hypothetical protein [Clostridia bacterium]